MAALLGRNVHTSRTSEQQPLLHDSSAISRPSFSPRPAYDSDTLAKVLTKTVSSTMRPISCSDVRSRVQRAEWADPNHGILYARTLTTEPSFRMAVHAQSYDNVRWKSIYLKGEYYETHVHERFVQILQNQPSQLVLDVGMNIGYYTLLSATLGHSVIGFEINPANLIRVCESLDLNQMDGSSAPVAMFQRGVSKVSNDTLRIVIPSNPGQAKMVVATSQDANTVTTITLDDFAEEYHWWDTRPTIALLKIDVEGLEPEILMGSAKLLKSGLVRNILTEFRDFNTPNSLVAFQLLLDNGYVLTNSDGTVLSKKATMALWNEYRHGKFRSESWQRTTRAFLLRRPFVMDFWFSWCGSTTAGTTSCTDDFV